MEHWAGRREAADASGDAPTAPLSPETAPPAPDLLRENRCDVCDREKYTPEPVRSIAELRLVCWRESGAGDSGDCHRLGYERLLRENARLRETVERLKQQVQLIAKNAGERFADYTEQLSRADKAEAELTRARAAHLENAELLAKANAEVERLGCELDGVRAIVRTVSADYAKLVGENTPLSARVAALEKQLSGLRGYHLCEATIPKPKPHRCNDTAGYYEPDGPLYWFCRRHAASLAVDDGTTSADRKGNALKAPLEPAAAAAPAKEGEHSLRCCLNADDPACPHPTCVAGGEP